MSQTRVETPTNVYITVWGYCGTRAAGTVPAEVAQDSGETAIATTSTEAEADLLVGVLRYLASPPGAVGYHVGHVNGLLRQLQKRGVEPLELINPTEPLIEFLYSSRKRSVVKSRLLYALVKFGVPYIAKDGTALIPRDGETGLGSVISLRGYDYVVTAVQGDSRSTWFKEDETSWGMWAEVVPLLENPRMNGEELALWRAVPLSAQWRNEGITHLFKRGLSQRPDPEQWEEVRKTAHVIVDLPWEMARPVLDGVLEDQRKEESNGSGVLEVS